MKQLLSILAGILIGWSGIAYGQTAIGTLDQWKSDGANITQRADSKPIKITGLTANQCLKLNGSNIVVSTSCSGGSGGSFPFNEGTNYNQLTYSTTTLISFQGGLAASSTSYFVNASTSKQTIFSNLWLPSLTSGLLGVDANGLVYKGATTTFASPLNYSANQVTLDTSGAWSGNAGTASALAADPSNCSAGTFAAGITVNGTAEGCTDVWTEAENTSAAYISGVTADSPLSGSGTAASHLTLGTVGFGNGGTNNTGLGSTRALLWSNGTSILGTSTPTAAQYYATSTIATSTFLGFFGIGTSTPDATAWFIVGSTTNNYFKIDKFSGNLTVNSQATSTFQRGVKIQNGALDIVGIATSTFANGVNLTGGCFAINSVCVSGGGGVTGSGAANQVAYWSGASSLTGTTLFKFDGANLGIGTATPYALLSVEGKGVFGDQVYSTYFTATSTTATSTFLGVLVVGTSTPDGTSAFIVGTTTNNFFRIGKADGNLTVNSQATSTFQRGISAASSYISGVANFIGELLVPFTANPTVDKAGEIAIDTNPASTSLRYFDGTSERVIYNSHDIGYFIASSTLAYMGSYGASGTTTLTILNPIRPTTLNSFYCKSNTGTAFLRFGDGTNWTTEVQCTSSGASKSGLSNNTFVMREDMQIQIGTSASSPSTFTITANITETAD